MIQQLLYEAGLRDLLWLGVVRESTLASQLRPVWTRVGLDFKPLPEVR